MREASCPVRSRARRRAKAAETAARRRSAIAAWASAIGPGLAGGMRGAAPLRVHGGDGPAGILDPRNPGTRILDRRLGRIGCPLPRVHGAPRSLGSSYSQYGFTL